MKKKIRKSKRPWFKKPCIYSVHKFFKDAEICYKMDWECRTVFQEEIYKVYKLWMATERISWRSQSNVKQIMVLAENWLNIWNTAKLESEKHCGNMKWKDDKLVEAEKYYELVRFIMDIVWMEKWMKGEEFFEVKNTK
jgi:hypothetical protein